MSWLIFRLLEEQQVFRPHPVRSSIDTFTFSSNNKIETGVSGKSKGHLGKVDDLSPDNRIPDHEECVSAWP